MNTIIRIQDYVNHLPHFEVQKWGRQEGVERRHIVAYLDGLPPSLCFGDASRQAKVNALRESCKGMNSILNRAYISIRHIG